MNDLINSIEKAIQNENWYAALVVSLTLPDIAGKIEFPEMSSSKRYEEWFKLYLIDKYTSKIGPNQDLHIFLNGNDCYALRCAYLHEGNSEIINQRASSVLEDFQFVAPKHNRIIHKNQLNKKLQLQVDIFCQDIIDGIKNWLNDISSEKKQKLNSFLKIYTI